MDDEETGVLHFPELVEASVRKFLIDCLTEPANTLENAEAYNRLLAGRVAYAADAMDAIAIHEHYQPLSIALATLGKYFLDRAGQ